MPAQTPDIPAAAAARLGAMGACIRQRRKLLRISAVNAAEAAGMSRATLHRIERGEPSVTMGAYVGAMAALGLTLEVVPPAQSAHPIPCATHPAAPAVPLPAQDAQPGLIRLDDYPQLKRIAWQLRGALELTPQEALALYERNWRHIDAEAMDPGERALVQRLAATAGGGRLLV